MPIFNNKPLLILLVSFIISFLFYISQLFYANIDNEKSAKVYSQPLISFIDQYEFLPDLIAENHLVQNLLKSNRSHIQVESEPTNQKLKSIALRTGASDIYIMDLSGLTIASSNYDTTRSFLGKNYHFRPYFQKAIEDRERQFYYAEGATTGIPGFFISSPIFINQKIHGVAVVKLELSDWEKDWRTSEKNILIADQNNIILLSTEDKWRYNTIGDINQQTVRKINSQKQFIQKEYTNIYSKSINLEIVHSPKNAFWIIDKQLFLVNSLSIPKIQWTLYYLVKHDTIFHSSLALFFLINALSFMTYFLVKGRLYIAESKRTTRLLEIKRKEEIKNIINNIHIGVMTLNSSGDIISVNPYAKDLLIPTLDNNNRVHINEVLSLQNYSLEDLSRLSKNESTTPNYFETTTIYATPQEIPILLSVRNIHTMDESVYLVTVINITKRKHAENELLRINESLEDIIDSRTTELQQAQEKLIQKNKAAALGNMAATIVHELSQPLTAMSSSIAAIKAKIEKQNYSGAIESTNRLSPLNNKMLDIIRLLKSFSYENKNNLTVINLGDLIKNSIDTFIDVFNERNIQIISHIDNEILIKGNPTKIDLVFTNIIQNAIDALEDSDCSTISISAHQKKHWAEISIHDTGKGVDNLTIKEMFSPYFTTKEIGKGLGLGLAICYEIIQEHEGTITAKNTDDGTCFCIKLPLTKEQQPDNESI